MNKIGLLKDIRYFDHKIDFNVPENYRRLFGIYRWLDNLSDHSSITFYSGQTPDPQRILAVHSQFYLDQIKSFCVQQNPFAYDKDTYLCEDSLYVAELAAGGCMCLADAIMSGEVKQGFALTRPPGHHAEQGRGMGFCILNNVAIVAQHLIQHYGMERIAILDFDVHHGNGTQEIFYDTDKVLYISLHQESLFPFTGKSAETGRDAGLGYNLNIPVFPRFGDFEYTYLIGNVIRNVIDQFLPEFILVSAGFDAHRQDSMSEIDLSTEWFHEVTLMLRYFANQYCDDRLLYILEGGYNTSSLEESLIAVIQAMKQNQLKKPGIPFSERAQRLIINHPIRNKWAVL